MEQYIPKSALVAEIEKLIDKGKYHDNYQSAFRDGNNSALYALKGCINIFEVKEVDLEKEIKNYLDEQPIVARSQGIDYKLVPSPETIAKHFYELGLNAQKGE